MKQMGSSPEGLSTEEARRRLGRFGPNEPVASKGTPLWRDVLQSLANPLVLILLAAATVAGFLGQTTDTVIIFSVVAFSTVLNVAQTYRSRQAVADLQRESRPIAHVRRDGVWIDIPSVELVPGDVIRLAGGDLVPADCRLLSSKDLHAQQAMLTGESVPEDKFASEGAVPDASQATSAASVFLGTSIVSGIGEALVVRTGRATMFGDIAARLVTRPPETEFERGLREFGNLILRSVVLLVAIVFLSGVVRERSLLDSLLFAVALAVGLTPEFLPMIVSITLARSAVHMARKKVIVKNLASMQNFGSMDILCSDKTGTLTTGEMSLERVIEAEGAEQGRCLRLAAINSELQSGLRNPLDDAILQKGSPGDVEKLGEVPFDFERRRVSVVARVDGKRLLITKGAPESVLAVCEEAGTSVEDLGREGLRVLAVASKEVEAKEDYSAADEAGMKFEGLLAFMDPPLPDAMRIINQLSAIGVRVKIITGDSAEVSRYICGEVGLDCGEIVLGQDIDKMTDAALQHVAEQRTLFARVSPAQKNRIISALKHRGHVVGYMGDGINDAPSLHTADVGISVSGGAAVAKDAADIVLTERSLEVLRDGILEGRMAFGNVMKYLLMGTSSNFGNVLSMAGGAIFLPFLPMLPTQILLNNFLYDLSQVTIPTDRVDHSFIRKPRRWDIGQVRRFMLIVGPISSLYDFLTFGVLLYVLHAGQREFHTGWFVESLATQVLVILVIRTGLNPFRSKPSRPLALSVVGVVLVGLILPFSPLAGDLGFVPLPPLFFAILFAMILTYLGLVELIKRRFFAQGDAALV